MDKLAIPEHKLHTVYYGIDPQIFYPATPAKRAALSQQLGWVEDKKVVIFIGALSDRRKGFDTLFTARQQLCKSPDWDADLVVIGVVTELPLWQHRADIAGVSNIHFLGFCSDVPNLLQAPDCWVAPTGYEAYGLGVHEALCCGLPALVSANAGVAERYPPQLQDLLISNCEDVIELVTQLQKWGKNRIYYSNLVSSFAQELRSYS